MKYKTTAIETQWKEKPPPKALLVFVELTDRYRQALDGNEITITEYIATWRNTPSYHPLRRAVDIRTRDMTRDVKLQLIGAMEDFAKAINKDLLKFREDIQIVQHRELWDTPQQHIHVELDNRKPHIPENYKRG